MNNPDTAYRVYRDVSGVQVNDANLPLPEVNPKAYDDILKFSNCDGVTVIGSTIECGKENCSDAVQGGGYIWKLCRFVTLSPSFGALTIKGAINGWALIGCVFDGHGDEFDVEVGQYDNYWTPSRPKTSGGFIQDCTSTDGRPIRVTVWCADVPVVKNSNVRIVKIPWIVWFPYFIFRYIQTHITK
jgi:hypothetical protein